MRKTIITVISMIIWVNLYAQVKDYYLFEMKDYFSFKCPKSWGFIKDSSISNINEEHSLISGRFVSNDSIERKGYEDCFDGIIFYVTVTEESLETALLKDELYVKKNDKYYSNFSYGANELKETENIKGDNWTGIHHFNTCKIFCKDDSISPIVDSCEFLYFSNDILTVNFSTTGMAIDKEILTDILNSFRFKE